ncbi:geranylgeranylglyceryl/heptaprenylglyceryl phosphate synthase [Flavobacterium sp. UMI-01]|uniref:geranylgeranylglyceryl/heptaprenylglyceryl phosphate synthase n=1 Tax=Flavobacterium sp. UMI-01 TaxID=1441053 RepID=UPI001C7D7D27|nr:geranylgeranylglyceryl/heptaprenylglyceryl phosphate synthase [Flavobacterium sp. UMI-01]GIZ07298.1 geranylgeranylglyceryl phosphate synthase [Flavobacterium sp. UMI-01]
MHTKTTLYQEILSSKAAKKKLLAILLDPDKIVRGGLEILAEKINQSPATHLFVGGSTMESVQMDDLILFLQEKIDLPILLFPGNPSQISDKADGILFLSLLSGRNPDFLIAHQVKAAPILKQTQLEIISTGYILVESGAVTAVERVSQTKPLPRDQFEEVLATALAGEMLGSKLIYLEAGSGAKQTVPIEMVRLVAGNIQLPLIVGGGIVSYSQIEAMYAAGADLVVIGTAFENDIHFFEKK